MKIILLGPPGVGKGTIATMVCQKLKIPHISTGDLFRTAVKNQTPLGIEVKGIIDAGNLVPDQTTINLLKERLSEADCKNGFILDGFPRTVDQAQKLDEELTIDFVLDFQASDDTLIKRLSGRRTCKKCKHLFNIYTSPPKQENICDLCQGELYVREDQKSEVIQHRLDVYKKQTKPLEKYYEETLHLIDSERDPNTVFEEVIKILTA